MKGHRTERLTSHISEHEVLKAQVNRDELVRRLAQTLSKDGTVEPMKGLTFQRYSSPTGLLHGVSHPSLCVIAQGSKKIHLGEYSYQYDPYHYLLFTADLPVVGEVFDASQEQPYLSLILTLDSTIVSSVMIESGYAMPQSHPEARALDVSPLGASLLDAVVRLVNLLDVPDEAPILAPLIMREIIYRLLKGEQGKRLHHIAVLGGHGHRIAKAVKRLHADFAQLIRVESLAEETGMSVSSFHSHFKSVTGMSPLQFQKQIQLQEARRLLLNENLDAASTAYRVGYNDAAHFNREYKRLFGEPPMRDVERLRNVDSGG